MGDDLPKIIINCGDPSGIGLDLIVFLAEKPFNASITILANKEALVQRAGLHGKKLAFQENVSLHKGDGRLYVKNIITKMMLFQVCLISTTLRRKCK